MSQVSLATLMQNLHKDIEHKLNSARTSFHHPGTKGDATEKVWIELLSDYLPKRYVVSGGHVVDSKGEYSDQIDIIIYDRQYSPLVFEQNGEKIIPVESVYAAFEVKQTLSKEHVEYAQDKIASVRRLTWTSLPVPTISGLKNPKPYHLILGGILSLDNGWASIESSALIESLTNSDLANDSLLDIGCCASHGYFHRESWKQHTKTLEPLHSRDYYTEPHDKAVTAFLFKLINMLQQLGTVPMIDVMAYAQHLSTSTPQQD
ncbi:hypothetical protein GCM10011297_10480 [Bacterioplanes sanyensis]|uniref:DUF6602 domain-containing protein n=1 Tax=Bacterioplanes sanyensis TaxID=1249553 RepID=UPI00167415B0|nr:DUF6602 domain-containing protein [Bacterioplanes sanyensis]GGY39180.1 hypothetical protein GCM10011297_10480 [Bacterioplanes sanyensis]